MPNHDKFGHGGDGGFRSRNFDAMTALGRAAHISNCCCPDVPSSTCECSPPTLADVVGNAATRCVAALTMQLTSGGIAAAHRPHCKLMPSHEQVLGWLMLSRMRLMASDLKLLHALPHSADMYSHSLDNRCVRLVICDQFDRCDTVCCASTVLPM